jgi:hypothetical protein
MVPGFATETSAKRILTNLFLTSLVLACFTSFSQNLSLLPASENLSAYAKNEAGQLLLQRFQCFNGRHEHNQFSITLCGDVPDNARPMKPWSEKEPGHVFLVLTMHDTACHYEPVAFVFGFYPRWPVSSLIFKNVRCEIGDNSKRSYDVRLEKSLSLSEFEMMLENSVAFARKKYNLNRYNCYNYALDVFNSLPGIEKLPVSKIRFPFIAGKGGSPCCLYRDLKKLQQKGSAWSPYINFGSFKAPVSCTN